MNQLLPQEVVDQIMREEQHFAAAPQAFFEVWKRGVEIAGPQWFGDGTREGLNQARASGICVPTCCVPTTHSAS
jgi:hypothetical protein